MSRVFEKRGPPDDTEEGSVQDESADGDAVSGTRQKRLCERSIRSVADRTQTPDGVDDSEGKGVGKKTGTFEEGEEEGEQEREEEEEEDENDVAERDALAKRNGLDTDDGRHQSYAAYVRLSDEFAHLEYLPRTSLPTKWPKFSAAMRECQMSAWEVNLFLESVKKNACGGRVDLDKNVSTFPSTHIRIYTETEHRKSDASRVYADTNKTRRVCV